jgi:hypothetical protein
VSPNVGRQHGSATRQEPEAVEQGCTATHHRSFRALSTGRRRYWPWAGEAYVAGAGHGVVRCLGAPGTLTVRGFFSSTPAGLLCSDALSRQHLLVSLLPGLTCACLATTGSDTGRDIGSAEGACLAAWASCAAPLSAPAKSFSMLLANYYTPVALGAICAAARGSTSCGRHEREQMGCRRNGHTLLEAHRSQPAEARHSGL